MAYQSIADTLIDADSPVTQQTMQRLHNNASVGKASRVHVTTAGNTRTWTVPPDVEYIRATIIAGGGASEGTYRGGVGAGLIIWAEVGPGQVISVSAGAAGQRSQVPLVARARGGADATSEADGARGIVDQLQEGAVYMQFQNQTILDSTGAIHGAAGVGGLVLIEY